MAVNLLGGDDDPLPALRRASGSRSSRPASARTSAQRVAASTTVGTPMAMTGTPRVSRFSAARALPTPDPGTMPVSAIWMVRQTRSRLREARASTARTQAGLESLPPRPVPARRSPCLWCPAPRPPGPLRAESAEMLRHLLHQVAGDQGCAPAALGPTASGVMARLPRPTTRALAPSGSFSSAPSSPPVPGPPGRRRPPPGGPARPVQGHVIAHRLSGAAAPALVEYPHGCDLIALLPPCPGPPPLQPGLLLRALFPEGFGLHRQVRPSFQHAAPHPFLVS